MRVTTPKAAIRIVVTAHGRGDCAAHPARLLMRRAVGVIDLPRAPVIRLDCEASTYRDDAIARGERAAARLTIRYPPHAIPLLQSVHH